MCLIVDKKEFKIEAAQQDIVVYKVLENHRWFIQSPYRGFVYEIGKEYRTKIKPPVFDFHDYCQIGEGFHSFLNEADAKGETGWVKDLRKWIKYPNSWRLCCYKCIIPKGTKVVYGKYNAKDTVVSEAIKVIEEI